MAVAKSSAMDQLSRHRVLLKYVTAIAAWWIPPFAVFALPIDTPHLTAFAMLYLYAGAIWVSLAFFVSFFLTRQKQQAVGAFVVAVMLSLVAWHNGFTFGARLHLFVNKSRYEAKIRELQRVKSNEEKNRLCDDECDAPVTDPPMVVFHYCHAFLNWTDLVYEPSGKIDASPDDLLKINGYLRATRRLSENWYIGYFGD
jgi:hypothetical protein